MRISSWGSVKREVIAKATLHITDFSLQKRCIHDEVGVRSVLFVSSHISLYDYCQRGVISMCLKVLM